MNRINQKDLEAVVNRINTATGNKLEPYTQKGKKLVANIGTYLIDWAYGGCKLEQMVTEGGGVTSITSGFVPKRELYYLMHSFLSGLETK